MDQDRLTELLVKKWLKTIDPEQEKELAQLMEREELAAVSEELNTIWDKAEGLRPQVDIDKEAEWERLKSGLQAPKAKSISFPVFARLAAAVLLLVVAGLVYYLNLDRRLDVEFRTASGERVEISLPDGSSVWLNQNSYLAYQDDYGNSDRAIVLQGEAFFDVQRNPERPFTVATGEVTTKVLGTSFNVRAYAELPRIVTTVSSGQVEFSLKGGEAMILEAGSKGIFNKDQRTLRKESEANQNFDAWMTRKLEFENSAIREVIPFLENHYGVVIDVSDTGILNCQFTSTFEGTSLEEVLEVLSITLNLSYTKSDSGYVLSGPGCN